MLLAKLRETGMPLSLVFCPVGVVPARPSSLPKIKTKRAAKKPRIVEKPKPLPGSAPDGIVCPICKKPYEHAMLHPRVAMGYARRPEYKVQYYTLQTTCSHVLQHKRKAFFSGSRDQCHTCHAPLVKDVIVLDDGWYLWHWKCTLASHDVRPSKRAPTQLIPQERLIRPVISDKRVWLSLSRRDFSSKYFPFHKKKYSLGPNFPIFRELLFHSASDLVSCRMLLATLVHYRRFLRTGVIGLPYRKLVESSKTEALWFIPQKIWDRLGYYARAAPARQNIHSLSHARC